MLSPCISTGTSASTGTWASASSCVPSPSRKGRATYSTRSELAVLSCGALIASVGTVGAMAAARKPGGSSTACGSPRGMDEASSRPWPSSSAT